MALNDVSVDFLQGEVHAIVGENGAGKSTLIKTITGSVQPERGSIILKGKEYQGIRPNEARNFGIEAIYQELNLIDCLTAAENICLGRKYGRLINQKAMNHTAQELFDRFKIDINPKTPVRELSNAKRQIVEIAKAVSKGARLLIMDEPTAPLTNAEISILMDIIRQLKAEGVTVIYISHRLDEIFQISDRVSVFRDGKYIVTKKTADTDRGELISLMVGRELSETYPERKTEEGEEVFRIENLTGNGVKNISLNLHRGTILGLAGLVGSGRSEIMKVVFGLKKKQWGRIFIKGTEVDIKNPREAIRCGLGIVPEDRKREGCLIMYSVEQNLGFNCIESISRGPVFSRSKLQEIGNKFIKILNIKTPSPGQKVFTLSGGNQQKVVIGKTLAAEADIIIFDEPTRGIDVGAKHEIYTLMNQLCADGKAIIMITSDMEELLGMSDRIIVFHEQEMAGEVPPDKFNQEYILNLASGGKESA